MEREEVEAMEDLRGVPITRHAMCRFVRRAEKIYGASIIENPEGTLSKILARAKLGNNNIGHYKRRTRLYGDTEMYTTKDGWRVVVAVDLESGAKNIVTIEHVCKKINQESEA